MCTLVCMRARKCAVSAFDRPSVPADGDLNVVYAYHSSSPALRVGLYSFQETLLRACWAPSGAPVQVGVRQVKKAHCGEQRLQDRRLANRVLHLKVHSRGCSRRPPPRCTIRPRAADIIQRGSIGLERTSSN